MHLFPFPEEGHPRVAFALCSHMPTLSGVSSLSCLVHSMLGNEREKKKVVYMPLPLIVSEVFMTVSFRNN